MLLYEMLIAIGIAVVLVVAAIDRLAARGPEEMALLRLGQAAAAQRRLVASAAQQEREARAAAAQRRLVAAAAQQEREARAAAGHPIRRRTRGTAPSASRYAHHSTRNTGREGLNADRGSSYARARAQWRTPGSGGEWTRDVRFDPFATDSFALRDELL
jgi:hypothetical protein